jgi:hypothetical protein
MQRSTVLTLMLSLGTLQMSGQSADATSSADQSTAPAAVQTTFRVRYVSGSRVYLVGGRNAG